MSKYRNRLVLVDAVQFHQLGDHPAVVISPTGFGIYPLGSSAPERQVSPGDWIVTGVRGEVFACTPSFFAQTYELAE